ncbi:MAG: copper-translocating P-type ATPase [Phycisphaerales bacterium]|nr:copper-translocating P-type ATPase [Phycisphaerales bacterium]
MNSAVWESTPQTDPDAVPEIRRIDIGVSGMRCASCVNHVESGLSALPGVESAEVNLATKTATVTYRPDSVPVPRLASAIRAAGYEPLLPEETAASGGRDGIADQLDVLERRAEEALWRRLIVSALLTVPVLTVAMSHGAISWLTGAWTLVLQFILTTIVMWYGAAEFFRSAWRGALRGIANMDTLISIGAGAAYAYSVCALAPLLLSRPPAGHAHAQSSVYFESAASIITLILLGKLMEARATRRTTDAIRRLVHLQPRTAQLIDAAGEREIGVDEIAVGDRLIARPGETIAVDGVVESGESDVDESMLTGESAPVIKPRGSDVFAGTINRTGAIQYRAVKIGAATALQQIVRLVREAQGARAPISRLADRISAIFVPVVLVIAAATFGGWLLLAAPEDRWNMAIAAAVAVLVIACPCALGLATPTAIMVATGRAAQRGMLIRGGAALERAGRVTDVFFDKTGTLTLGRPNVAGVAVIDPGVTPDALIALAAAAERFSEHPIARAIVSEAVARGTEPAACSDFKAHVGGGVRAVVAGKVVLVGSVAFLVDQDVEAPLVERAAKSEFAEAAQSLVLVARDREVIGAISLMDELRATAKAAVISLRELGVTVWLVSGDRPAAVAVAAKSAGIAHYEAALSPAQKAGKVRELQATGRVVAMVGDGINDAPALAAADVGLAMSSGTDIAISAADITLLRGDPQGAVEAIALSRAALRTIRQNLFWAFAYNVLSIPIAAGVLYPLTGWLLSPMLASATMALSSVSVVMNSLRLKLRA